ncbi:MAG: iron ABC transporter permease [Bacteroidales bacterium]|jgi:iron complex transport system permease protein|nr:iron ABC transporter permease [Bacteroidales bacterium]
MKTLSGGLTKKTHLILLFFLLLALMVTAVFIGAEHSTKFMIVHLRIPRIIMSVFAGASLALCGAVFQTIFRNPICDPYILGISSGASIGAALAFILGLDFYLFGVTSFALVTAFITLMLLLGITRFSKIKSTYIMLLAGISLNFLLASALTLLMVLNHQEMQKIIFWTMGRFATVSPYEIFFYVPIFLICTFFTFILSKDLNLIQLGEMQAKSLGVNTKKIIYITLLLSSVLIATTVSICGVIGFIGLITPHLARILWGNNTKHLFAFSILLGAIFMLIADSLARVLVANTELPVGSITALVGAPYFIYLIAKK